MVKSPCYVCKKNTTLTHSIRDYWRSPQTPEGMTREDLVCYECYLKVKNEVIQYKNAHKEEIDRLNKEEDLELEKIREDFEKG